MGISRLPAFRLTQRQRQFVAVIGLCAILQAVGDNACSTYFSSAMIPEYAAAANNLRQKLIKQLMPADPESSEVMLADRGLDRLDPSKALG